MANDFASIPDAAENGPKRNAILSSVAGVVGAAPWLGDVIAGRDLAALRIAVSELEVGKLRSWRAKEFLTLN